MRRSSSMVGLKDIPKKQNLITEDENTIMIGPFAFNKKLWINSRESVWLITTDSWLMGHESCVMENFISLIDCSKLFFSYSRIENLKSYNWVEIFSFSRNANRQESIFEKLFQNRPKRKWIFGSFCDNIQPRDPCTSVGQSYDLVRYCACGPQQFSNSRTAPHQAQ